LRCQARRAQQERADGLVLLDGEPAHVQRRRERLQPSGNVETDRCWGRQAAALPQDQRAGQQVAEPLIVPGEQDEQDGEEAGADAEVHQPEQRPDGRVPEPDRPALLGHDPQAERGLANGPPSPERLADREIAEVPAGNQDDQDRSHQPVRQRGVGQRQREDPQERDHRHDGRVDYERQDARPDVGGGELQRHRFGSDHARLFELRHGDGLSAFEGAARCPPA
jgi:hypothetical protein